MPQLDFSTPTVQKFAKPSSTPHQLVPRDSIPTKMLASLTAAVLLATGSLAQSSPPFCAINRMCVRVAAFSSRAPLFATKLTDKCHSPPLHQCTAAEISWTDLCVCKYPVAKGPLHPVTTLMTLSLAVSTRHAEVSPLSECAYCALRYAHALYIGCCKHLGET